LCLVVIRFQTEGFLVLTNGRVNLALVEEGGTEVVVGLGEIRFQADGFLVLTNGPVKLALDEEGGTKVVVVNDDTDLLVVTEVGYGKRTRVSEYPRKGRGGLGVKTVQLAEAKGRLAGASVVRDGYQVMLISDGGTVIKMPVEDVKRLGRATQGVIVMRLRGDEHVSSLALVAEPVEADLPEGAPGEPRGEDEDVAPGEVELDGEPLEDADLADDDD
jgi:DNA gyrase subunit A